MKKKLLSDAIEETIELMIHEYKSSITTEYTMKIGEILLMSKHLYTSFDAKSISERANKYITKYNANTRQKNIHPNLKNRSDILDFMCFDLIDNYVNVHKLNEECND